MLPEDYLENYQNLFSVFSAIHPLSKELKSAIVKNSHIAQVKKKTVILSAGESSNAIYFIVSGAARVYYLDKDGKQTNTWFLFENELLISVYGFFTGQPSFEYIETMENTTLVVVKKEKLDEIYRKFMEFNFIGRKLTEYYYIRNELQTNELRMLSAKERYENLLKRNPHFSSASL
ncbi:Cyclic nucleotide-binding domain-containing protein [Pedobacter suwonensis]|uniref:Cyclic nucleotide-binding domain-containing protein n=1 Tax=Pedobacter suwonensis TaxID=332999 RepID=A0A1I0TG66_9SPHI|nr:Crp/Fnr family transcriptional regulator [Pedobacter suwonensis]SFA50781.1 Cyclic nucleotide-binding domain-containing protein [Pedobacter suwonensis]